MHSSRTKCHSNISQGNKSTKFRHSPRQRYTFIHPTSLDLITLKSSYFHVNLIAKKIFDLSYTCTTKELIILGNLWTQNDKISRIFRIFAKLRRVAKLRRNRDRISPIFRREKKKKKRLKNLLQQAKHGATVHATGRLFGKAGNSRSLRSTGSRRVAKRSFAVST